MNPICKKHCHLKLDLSLCVAECHCHVAFDVFNSKANIEAIQMLLPQYLELALVCICSPLILPLSFNHPKHAHEANF